MRANLNVLTSTTEVLQGAAQQYFSNLILNSTTVSYDENESNVELEKKLLQFDIYLGKINKKKKKFLVFFSKQKGFFFKTRPL